MNRNASTGRLERAMGERCTGPRLNFVKSLASSAAEATARCYWLRNLKPQSLRWPQKRSQWRCNKSCRPGRRQRYDTVRYDCHGGSDCVLSWREKEACRNTRGSQASSGFQFETDTHVRQHPARIADANHGAEHARPCPCETLTDNVQGTHPPSILPTRISIIEAVQNIDDA